MKKTTAFVVAIAIAAAGAVLWLVVRGMNEKCPEGTQAYEAGGVKTCVAPSQSALLTCLGQVRTVTDVRRDESAGGDLTLKWGGAEVRLGAKDGQTVVDKSTTSDPVALKQIEACTAVRGEAGQRAEGHSVAVQVQSSSGVQVQIDNSEHAGGSAAPSDARAPASGSAP
jgi:hypothetical protein